MSMLRRLLIPGIFLASIASSALAAEKPNILVIMADDVGQTNISAYSHGLMTQTPNLDRIAEEGMNVY